MKKKIKHGLNRNVWLTFQNITKILIDNRKTSVGIYWHDQNFLNFQLGAHTYF